MVAYKRITMLRILKRLFRRELLSSSNVKEVWVVAHVRGPDKLSFLLDKKPVPYDHDMYLSMEVPNGTAYIVIEKMGLTHKLRKSIEFQFDPFIVRKSITSGERTVIE